MESKRIRLDTNQVSNDTLLFNMPIMAAGNKQIPQSISNIRFQNLTSIVDPNLISKAAANNNIIIRSTNSRSQLNNNNNSSNPRSIQQAVVFPSTNFQPTPTNNILRLSNSQPFNYTGHSNNNSSNNNNNPNNNNNNTGSISIPAIQVRIGSKKFKPISNVTFKDDGILFTLKDYSFAPVLLNARAIQKCKANLSTHGGGYPVLFLFLESSCMRQIRNIFSLTHKEFSANSLVEFKQCITIFPHFASDSARNSPEQVIFALKKAFEAMVKRYPRNTSILEVITDEQVIDTLLMSSQEKPDSSEVTNNNTNNVNNINTNNSNNNANNSNNNNRINANTTAKNHNTNNNANNNNHNTNNAASRTSQQARPQTTTTTVPQQQQQQQALIQQQHQAQALPQQQAPFVSSHPHPHESPGQGAPLLTVPNDKSLWQAMQKNLVRGVLYHVMMPDGQHKYCVWDGVQLVPCLVQSTEVQIECTYIRFGTSLHACIGNVKVRAEANSCMTFRVKGNKGNKPIDVSINAHDMVVNQVFPNGHNTVIFVSVTPVASERISNHLELNDGGGGGSGVGNKSVFDCGSSEISKKYIMLFLKALNKDQEDALLAMKMSCDTSYLKKSSHMFVKLDLSTTMHLLAKIAEDSNEKAKQLLDSLQPLGPHNLEKLLKRLTVGSNTNVHSVDDDDDDDGDDDDLVMVQQELGVKCPYTQQVMQEPVRNVKCGHNYEKEAILQFIAIKKGTAKCPYAGCANAECLSMEALEENVSLKAHIAALNAAVAAAAVASK